MFGQFSSNPPTRNPSSVGGTPTAGIASSSSATSGSSPSAPPAGPPGSRPSGPGRPQRRGKRSQVPRACDTCRLYRSKCDNNEQCAPCVARGVKCTNTGQKPAYTLASATQRIEELTEQLREVQEELAYCHQHHGERAQSPRLLSPRLDYSTVGSTDPAGYTDYDDDDATIQEGHISLGKYLERMTSPLPFQPHTKTESFAESNPTQLATAGPRTTNAPVGFASISDPSFHQAFLTKSEEDYFLNTYWHSYNALVPIVYQPDFEQLYNGLWDKINYEQYPQANRQAYPLVDIVLALCLQYGMNGALGPQHRAHDAVLEGRRYYERCLHHISTELEHPHIATLQCYVLCTIYLLNASKANTAYHMLGLAVRIAYNLGIHRELDDPSLKLGRRQLYRRIWWSIYSIDIRLSIELSLPTSIQEHHISCHYPTAPLDPSPSPGPIGDETTFLRFHVYYTKLHTAARKIYTYMYRTRLQVQASQSHMPPIEVIAQKLDSKLQLLTNVWRSSVPAALQFARSSGRANFTTDCSRISFDFQAPPWLNRQRFFLEMSYHMIMLLFHQPFLRHLCPNPEQQRRPPPIETVPITNRLAITALHHARSLIYLINQALADTDLLTGWYSAFNSASVASFCIRIYLNHHHQYQLQSTGGFSAHVLKDTLITSLHIFSDFSPSHQPSRDAHESLSNFLSSISGASGGSSSTNPGISPSVGSTPISSHSTTTDPDAVENKVNIIRVLSPVQPRTQDSYSTVTSNPTPPPPQHRQTPTLVLSQAQVPPPSIQQQPQLNWQPVVMQTPQQAAWSGTNFMGLDTIFPEAGVSSEDLQPVWTGGFAQPEYGHPGTGQMVGPDWDERTPSSSGPRQQQQQQHQHSQHPQHPQQGPGNVDMRFYSGESRQ